MSLASPLPSPHHHLGKPEMVRRRRRRMVEEGGTMNVRQQLEARRRRREEEVHRAEFVTRWRPDTTFGYKSFSSDRNHPGAPRRQPRLYKRRSSRDIVLYHDGQLYQHQSPPHSFR